MMKSFFKKLFSSGEVLEIMNSPVNGQIKVIEDFGGRSMIIGGVSQSGYLVEKLWKKAFSGISNFKFQSIDKLRIDPEQDRMDQISNCLVLGLGCGNAARIVSERFSGCKIVGVEIDPTVIEIGKKYFYLNKISNLKIVIGDAFVLEGGGEKCEVSREVGSGKWDLVFVDLYQGQEFPKEAEGQQFINGIKKILSNDGLVIFNRLSYGKYKKDAESFANELKKYFSFVQTKKAVTNLLIFCSQ